MTEEDWEQLGREVANNDHLEEFNVHDGALNNQKMTSLFRGLTRSSSIDAINLYENDPGVYDVQIESLDLRSCGLSSLEIDSDYIPANLAYLDLSKNNVGPDGCLGLATLLQKENSTLDTLSLDRNNIDDEGVQILANALRSNTSLTRIILTGNEQITREGMISLLKLVNDISSIQATLQSNHTMTVIEYDNFFDVLKIIDDALHYNNDLEGDAVVGKAKVINTQLNSEVREVTCFSQGLDSQHHSIAVPLTEIGPQLLPEILEIVAEQHGHSDLYKTLIVSLADLWTTINRKQVIIDKAKEVSDQIDSLVAKKLELESVQSDLYKELAAIEQKEADESNVSEGGGHSNKRQKMS